MIIDGWFDGALLIASLFGLTCLWTLARIAGLLRRQRAAEWMLRERIARWKARTAAAAGEAGPER